MSNYPAFKAFIDSFTGSADDSVLEAVLSGYRMIFEDVENINEYFPPTLAAAKQKKAVASIGGAGRLTIRKPSADSGRVDLFFDHITPTSAQNANA